MDNKPHGTGVQIDTPMHIFGSTFNPRTPKFRLSHDTVVTALESDAMENLEYGAQLEEQPTI